MLVTKDARQLAYLEVGDPHGPLVIHNHGGPSSRRDCLRMRLQSMGFDLFV
jgi:pimeloyl-ACP methyl ester carboxylesterase